MESTAREMGLLVADFRRTIEDASRQLLDLDGSRSELPRATGKWSPKEIIGHLIDSAAHNHLRFVQAQLCDHLEFPGYEQEEWVRLQHYNEEPWQQLVQLWRNYNLHLAHLMSVVSEEALKRNRAKHNLSEIAWKTVPQTESVTLEYFMRDYIGHLQNHLKQILSAEL